MERALKLMDVANSIEAMTNKLISEPISIVYEEMTPMTRAEDKQLQRFLVINEDEYFLISRGGTLLYVVDVTADSILTAAHELMALIARKF